MKSCDVEEKVSTSSWHPGGRQLVDLPSASPEEAFGIDNSGRRLRRALILGELIVYVQRMGLTDIVWRANPPARRYGMQLGLLSSARKRFLYARSYATMRRPRDRESPMNSHLVYRPREGAVFGTAAGKPFRLAALRNQTAMNMEAWRQAARPAGTVAPRVTDWPKAQELPTTVSAGTVRHRLTVVENAALEIYDHPGAHAGHFDVVGPGRAAGGPANHPHHGRVVSVNLPLKPGFLGGGFCIHGSPPCSNPRCIVILQNWDSLFQALKTARQVSLIIEL
jgi:hypothetical protein